MEVTEARPASSGGSVPTAGTAQPLHCSDLRHAGWGRGAARWGRGSGSPTAGAPQTARCSTAVWCGVVCRAGVEACRGGPAADAVQPPRCCRSVVRSTSGIGKRSSGGEAPAGGWAASTEMAAAICTLPYTLLAPLPPACVSPPPRTPLTESGPVLPACTSPPPTGTGARWSSTECRRRRWRGPRPPLGTPPNCLWKLPTPPALRLRRGILTQFGTGKLVPGFALEPCGGAAVRGR